MQKKRSEEQLAQDLFLQTDLTQQQIADLLDVSRRSVWLWIKNGRWEEMKFATRQAPGFILQDIHNHITAVNDKIRERDPGDRCPTMEEVEKLRKLINMTNSIQKNNAGSYIQAYGELMQYLNKQDRDLALKLTSHVGNYVTGTLCDKNFELTKECNANVRQVIDNLKKHNETVIVSSSNDIPGTAEGSPNDDMPQTDAGTSKDDAHEKKVQDFIKDYADLWTDTPDEVECDNNVIMCDNPRPTEEQDVNTYKSATVLPHEENTNSSTPLHYHTENFSENVIMNNEVLSADCPCQTDPDAPGCPCRLQLKKACPLHPGTALCHCKLPLIMNLPPAERPSPFRDGNTLWVINLDDADERYNNLGQEWGERKIGDIIKRYSDLDEIHKRA